MTDITPGDIVEVVFLKEKMMLRCVENWGDQLFCADDEQCPPKMMVAPIQDCTLIEKRDPPTRTFHRRK